MMMDQNPLIIASISTAHVWHTYSQDAGRTNNRGCSVLPRAALKPAKHQQQRKALCKCAAVLNARSETNTPARTPSPFRPAANRCKSPDARSTPTHPKWNFHVHRNTNTASPKTLFHHPPPRLCPPFMRLAARKRHRTHPISCGWEGSWGMVRRECSIKKSCVGQIKTSRQRCLKPEVPDKLSDF